MAVKRKGWWKSAVSNVAELKSGTAYEVNAMITRSLELVLTNHKKQRIPAVRCAGCLQACSASRTQNSVMSRVGLNELR